MPSSVDSLDDNSSVASSYDEEEERRIAQQEWEDSLNQLQQLVGVVLMPFFGKWLGRRWSHIGSFVLPSPPHVSDNQQQHTLDIYDWVLAKLSSLVSQKHEQWKLIVCDI